ncbi:MAG: class I SAM-dependent methyltransferase [Anaerolineaceae bacterium]
MDKPGASELTWWERHYDEPGFIGDYFRKRMAKALAWIADGNFNKQEALIFDVGCGGGQLAVQAAAQGYRVTGMDSSLNMLRKSKELSEKRSVCLGRFFQGDIECMPVKSGSLDAVVCLGVISYLKTEFSAMDEFARVLKPGGLLVVSATNKARLIKRLDIPMMILSLKNKVASGSNSDGKFGVEKLDDLPQRSYWIPKFFQSLQFAGFRVSDLVTFPYDLPTLFGREFLPRRISEGFAARVDGWKHLPLVESVGSMWMVKACKK